MASPKQRRESRLRVLAHEAEMSEEMNSYYDPISDLWTKIRDSEDQVAAALRLLARTLEANVLSGNPAFVGATEEETRTVREYFSNRDSLRGRGLPWDAPELLALGSKFVAAFKAMLLERAAAYLPSPA